MAHGDGLRLAPYKTRYLRVFLIIMTQRTRGVYAGFSWHGYEFAQKDKYVKFSPTSPPTSPKFHNLPDSSCWIFLNCLVRCKNCQTVYKCLTYNHPVKRIPMIAGQLGEMEHGLFVQWEAFNFMQLTLIGNCFFWWFRKR